MGVGVNRPALESGQERPVPIGLVQPAPGLLESDQPLQSPSGLFAVALEAGERGVGLG